MTQVGTEWGPPRSAVSVKGWIDPNRARQRRVREYRDVIPWRRLSRSSCLSRPTSVTAMALMEEVRFAICDTHAETGEWGVVFAILKLVEAGG